MLLWAPCWKWVGLCLRTSPGAIPRPEEPASKPLARVGTMHTVWAWGVLYAFLCAPGRTRLFWELADRCYWYSAFSARVTCCLCYGCAVVLPLLLLG